MFTQYFTVYIYITHIIYTTCNFNIKCIKYIAIIGGGWDNPWGYHAFSTNNGRLFEGFYENVHAYEGFTEYNDGTNFTFARCERPHLIMDDDGYTPLALSNAVQPGGQSLDYSFTLVRPINQN